MCAAKMATGRVKDSRDLNGLAAVDRKIQQIKTAISGRMMEEGLKDWHPLLADVVKALNEAPSDALHGKAPDAIDDVAEFDLQKLMRKRPPLPRRSRQTTRKNLQPLVRCVNC